MSALVVHAGGMAKAEEKYLTIGGVLGALTGALLTQTTCWVRGHDPVVLPGARLCRRCYGTLR